MKSHFAIQANPIWMGKARERSFLLRQRPSGSSMARAEDIHHFVELQLTEVIGRWR